MGKNCMIIMLEMSFTLLNKRNELMILALTRYAAQDIRRIISHIALRISTHKTLSGLCINISKI